jgi:hypothetical protein
MRKMIEDFIVLLVTLQISSLEAILRPLQMYLKDIPARVATSGLEGLKLLMFGVNMTKPLKHKNPQAKYRASHKDEIALQRAKRKKHDYAVNKLWREANKAKIVSDGKIYREKNRDRINAVKKIHRDKNKETLNAGVRNWKKLNKGKVCAYTTARKVGKVQRTPEWANLARIREIYELAAAQTRLLGKSFHVDHIVPLNGKLVSGLHCEDNLQIITATENMQKNNKYAV